MLRQAKFVAATFLALLCACAAAQAPQALRLQGDYGGTHDPSIAYEHGTYYVFATGNAPGGGLLPIRCSADLITWHHCGHVFDAMPSWIQQRSPQTHDLWAPDISVSHGEYRLYYAYSLFGKNTSGIGLATNRTLDPASPQYKWVDDGLVLDSRATDNFNAIDPNYFEDNDGHAWLTFGSFWDGIQMRPLDPATGKPLPHGKAYWLASRSDDSEAHAIEAPFVVAHGGFYYLFVSVGFCCRGARSTYRTVVGRSQSVTGPYIDQQGKPMLQGGGTLVLTANQRWVGPGGASVLLNTKRQDLIVFHAYDCSTGKPALQISTITWQDGWPHAALSTGP